jgi:F0F1-type ATP synthase membrane subunit c/vacuolar-type H+-ATPase subunit K
MSFMEQIGGLLSAYTSGSGATNRQEARDHYDQISSAVPLDMLASVIGPALSSLGTSQVQERIFNSATEMTPEQRGGFMQSLLGGLMGSGANLPGLLSSLGIGQSVIDNPESATPEDVSKLAAHTHDNEPGIFQKAMEFYAEHPTLVKVLGTMAIAAIARQISNRAS